jgi:hypothetical protein
VSITQEPQYVDVVGSFGTKVSSVSTGTSYNITCRADPFDQSPYDLILRKNDGKIRINMPEDKENENMERVTIPMPTKMLINGRATVVFFADGTKVAVKLPEGVENNEYNAFCAAITKKMFGTNSRVKRKIERIREVEPTEEEKKAALEQAKKDAEAKRQAEVDRKIERMARQMVIEKLAKARAKEMLEEGAC